MDKLNIYTLCDLLDGHIYYRMSIISRIIHIGKGEHGHRHDYFPGYDYYVSTYCDKINLDYAGPHVHGEIISSIDVGIVAERIFSLYAHLEKL